MPEIMHKGSHPAINVAVVGHTNTGKTSLIRTLLRDDQFGEIEDLAGTTRYVEKSTIFCADDAVLDLFDTPGFEDSSALLQALDELSKTLHARMPADLLHAFIAQADAFPDFEQEIKVLRQAINSDVLLYIICGIVMGSWILPLYSIVTYAAGSKTVDFIVDGLDSAKAAMIITTHPDEIARAVSEEFGTGLTIIDAHGFYSDTPKTVLYVVVNRFQTVKLKTLVKGVDANAYMAISPVADLLHGSKEEETA